MKTIEITAKNVRDALNEGYQLLGRSIGDKDIDVEVLCSGGIFRKAKVKMTLNDEQQRRRDERRDNKPREGKRDERRDNKPREDKRDERRDNKPREDKRDERRDNKPREDKRNERVDNRPREDKRDERVENRPREDKRIERIENKPREDKRVENQTTAAPKMIKADKDEKQNETVVFVPKAISSEPIKYEPKVKYEDRRTDNKPRKPEAKPETPRDERPVEYEPISREERGARMKAEITDEIKDAATNYLKGLLEKMKVEGHVETNVVDNEINLNIVTEDKVVIGYRGEALDAIEYMVSIAINKYDDKFYRVNVDSNSYRDKRKNTLIELAHKMADKCVKTGRKISLEPMNSAGRKVIHSALGDDNRVLTRSEGHEPARHVVIFPKNNNKN